MGGGERKWTFKVLYLILGYQIWIAHAVSNFKSISSSTSKKSWQNKSFNVGYICSIQEHFFLYYLK